MTDQRASGGIVLAMATFLTREDIVYHLGKIIEEADRELVLISPYIKADDETKNLLKNKTRATTIHVIYGKKKLKSSEKSYFDELGIKTSFLKNLHAKCYLNEKEALLTSMNLYEFSQEHNDEMGILVSRQDDEELYEAIHRQATSWKTASSETEPASKGKVNSAATKARTNPSRTRQDKPRDGFCIRCRDVVPAYPEQPYCRRCYATWKRYKKNSYEEEKHCHTCGSEHTATLKKPLCRACYTKYKDFFTFAS